MSDTPEPSGVLLAQVLKVLGMSQATLASRTGLTAKHVNQVCQQHAGISARSAVLLEEVTGVNAELWMWTQARYDIASVRAARLHAAVERKTDG